MEKIEILDYGGSDFPSVGSIWDECGKGCYGDLAWASNFSAGAGSALTVGLTDLVNHFTGPGQIVDRKSKAYWTGATTGTAVGVVVVPYLAGPRSFLARSILNNSRYVRLGWNYYRGSPTYRLVIGSAAGGIHAHLDQVVPKNIEPSDGSARNRVGDCGGGARVHSLRM